MIGLYLRLRAQTLRGFFELAAYGFMILGSPNAVRLFCGEVRRALGLDAEIPADCVRDTITGMAVTVRVDGFGHFCIRCRVSKRVIGEATARFLSTHRPAFAVPAAMASGRSVSLRMTRTGFPRAGASSCRPPESVITSSSEPSDCASARHSAGQSDGPLRIAQNTIRRTPAPPGSDGLDRPPPHPGGFPPSF